ncbi:hypothetical protein TWF718_010680 [Orbilia javanica]|uniref:Uncharacterized protein n=1 Tax=Orbilia javanica TaxID=47235 RepID=A0AAN8MSV0_9PEZI
MSQTFHPPQIHILAYKTISINSQAPAIGGVPLICGVFVYINDPLGDQSDTIGVKCSLKDVPPPIMAIASDQMQRIQQSERDTRVKWVTDDRVYVKEPTYTFGMVKIVDPDIGMLGSLPVPVGGVNVNHGVGVDFGVGVGGGGLYERLRPDYTVPNDEDVVMGFNIDPGHVGHLSHAQALNFVNTQGQDISEHNGSALPALVNGIKREKDEVNGFGGHGPSSVPASTVGASSQVFTDGSFVHKEIKREGGVPKTRIINGSNLEGGNGEGIPGIYGSYAT